MAQAHAWLFVKGHVPVAGQYRLGRTDCLEDSRRSMNQVEVSAPEQQSQCPCASTSARFILFGLARVPPDPPPTRVASGGQSPAIATCRRCNGRVRLPG